MAHCRADHSARCTFSFEFSYFQFSSLNINFHIKLQLNKNKYELKEQEQANLCIISFQHIIMLHEWSAIYDMMACLNGQGIEGVKYARYPIEKSRT